MRMTVIALMLASVTFPAAVLAEGSSSNSTNSPGASKYAPGQQMNNSTDRKSGAPGASE